MSQAEGPGQVGAVVLAAGLSTRMGQAKQLLPWGAKAMVRHVVDTLIVGGVAAAAIQVVVGYQRAAVEDALADTGVGTILNPHYDDGSMLRSLQTGLSALAKMADEGADLTAALVALGDQPQIHADVVRQVIAAWQSRPAPVVAPSFDNKRGHPMLFDRLTWPQILAAEPAGSPRELLAMFAGRIAYLELGDDTILRDIDTPEDYRRELERRV